MTLEVWVSNDAGEYHQIDVSDLQYTTYRDFQQGESLEFETAWATPIKPLNFVRLEENGSVLFRGAALANSGKISISTVNGTSIRQKLEGTAKWECESIPQLLKRRYSWPMRWGAPAIVSGYEALTLKQVLGSDPPSQSSGVDQYVPGAIWMAQSYLSVSPESKTEGVWYYPGWGTASRAGTKDVYVGGHICTEVDAFGDLTNDYYRVYRNLNDLWVYGYGPGDFGPVCIDGAFDYGLRWGNVDKEDDYLLTALDVGIENYWQLIEDFLFDMGIYLRLRHTNDYTYLDGSINPWGRGSSGGGAFTLRSGDYTSLKRAAPRNIPPSALIGLGAGEDITKVRYSLADLSKRGPWIEELYEVSEGRLAPKGRLEDMVSMAWTDISESDYISMETPLGHFRTGDWLDIYLSDSEMVTAQISEINRDISDIRKIKLGGAYASPKYAFLEKQASLAVEAMRAGQVFGAQEDTSNLGPATTASISWTPAALADRDTAEITVDLRATTPADSSQQNLSVAYTLTITNTLYPGGQVIATLPWMPWGADPVFEGLEITKWCALDGTEETLEIDVVDPTGTLTETLGYTITVRGIGRYGQSAIKTLNISGGAVSSTLDGDIWVEQLDSEGGSTTGNAYYNLANVAAPSYDFKVVLVHTAWLSGYSSNKGWSRPYIKTHGSTYYGGVRYPGLQSQQYEDEWIKNPYTGAVWTQQELDDLQIGIILNVEPHYVAPMYRNVINYCRCGALKVELR